ncbi:MAG: homocysteine S-methyltransferase family protein, partial [Muribaculaceae bacterium]|nr:homocysteine S-methyltransferase family protein [Muribaculaceae bacterium]
LDFTTKSPEDILVEQEEEHLFLTMLERLAEAMRPLLRDCRLNIIGGCCGTTPEHIRVLANEIRHLTINA